MLKLIAAPAPAQVLNEGQIATFRSFICAITPFINSFSPILKEFLIQTPAETYGTLHMLNQIVEGVNQQSIAPDAIYRFAKQLFLHRGGLNKISALLNNVVELNIDYPDSIPAPTIALIQILDRFCKNQTSIENAINEIDTRSMSLFIHQPLNDLQQTEHNQFNSLAQNPKTLLLINLIRLYRSTLIDIRTTPTAHKTIHLLDQFYRLKSGIDALSTTSPLLAQCRQNINTSASASERLEAISKQYVLGILEISGQFIRTLTQNNVHLNDLVLLWIESMATNMEKEFQNLHIPAWTIIKKSFYTELRQNSWAQAIIIRQDIQRLIRQLSRSTNGQDSLISAHQSKTLIRIMNIATLFSLVSIGGLIYLLPLLGRFLISSGQQEILYLLIDFMATFLEYSQPIASITANPNTYLLKKSQTLRQRLLQLFFTLKPFITYLTLSAVSGNWLQGFLRIQYARGINRLIPPLKLSSIDQTARQAFLQQRTNVLYSILIGIGKIVSNRSIRFALLLLFYYLAETNERYYMQAQNSLTDMCAWMTEPHFSNSTAMGQHFENYSRYSQFDFLDEYDFVNCTTQLSAWYPYISSGLMTLHFSQNTRIAAEINLPLLRGMAFLSPILEMFPHFLNSIWQWSISSFEWLPCEPLHLEQCPAGPFLT